MTRLGHFQEVSRFVSRNGIQLISFSSSGAKEVLRRGRFRFNSQGVVSIWVRQVSPWLFRIATHLPFLRSGLVNFSPEVCTDPRLLAPRLPVLHGWISATPAASGCKFLERLYLDIVPSFSGVFAKCPNFPTAGGFLIFKKMFCILCSKRSVRSWFSTTFINFCITLS